MPRGISRLRAYVTTCVRADPEGGLILRAWPVLASLCALTAAAVFLPAGMARALIFWLASGAFLVAVVFDRFGCVEWIVSGLIASFVLFSLLGPLVWPWGAAPHLAVLGVMVAASVREWRRKPRMLSVHAGAVDLASAFVMALASLPIAVVAKRNGFDPDGTFVARHYFGGDSFYFYSFAEAFVNGRHLPVEVPFVAGAQNAYRTWLHAGFGGLRLLVGQPSPLAGIVLVPVFLLATQGLAVWSFIRSSGSEPSAQAAALSGALAMILFILRPDLAIYPTGQAFAIGALRFAGWLWRGPSSSVAAQALSIGAALVVVMGHGLTGAVAVAFVGVRSVQTLFRREGRRSGAVFALASAGLGLVFLLVNRMPYAGARHAIKWSVIAHGAWAFVDGWQVGIAFIVVGCVLAWRTGGLVPITVLLLGVLFRIGADLPVDASEAWFAQVNADRFVYFACVTLALALVGTSRRRLALVIALSFGMFAGWRPATLGTWLHNMGLATADPIRIEPAKLLLFREICRKTPANARILTTVALNVLPAFTGRVQSPVAPNLWAMGMIKPSQFEARVKDQARFAAASATEKIAIMDRGEYSHALLRANLAVGQVPSWVQSQFPGGSVEVLYADGDSVLLARRR
jgi:hypothetical protein